MNCLRAALPGSGFAAILISARSGRMRARPLAAPRWSRRPRSAVPRALSSTCHATLWQGGGPPGASPFAVDPDTPATKSPPLAWIPSLDIATVTIVRPVPWARGLGDLAFRPRSWADRIIRIAAPGGIVLLLRRHAGPETPVWIPERLQPAAGRPFGIYLHPDRGLADRTRAAASFRRAIGRAAAPCDEPHPHAHRLATMLCVHDMRASGASLRDIAGELLDPMPDDWRMSSERSDLRRLADAAVDMVAGGYRRLLGSRPRP